MMRKLYSLHINDSSKNNFFSSVAQLSAKLEPSVYAPKI